MARFLPRGIFFGNSGVQKGSILGFAGDTLQLDGAEDKGPLEKLHLSESAFCRKECS